MFAGNLIIYRANRKEATGKKKTELKSKLVRLQETGSTYNYRLHSHSLATIKVLFIIASKNMKYLEINLTKYMQL